MRGVNSKYIRDTYIVVRVTLFSNDMTVVNNIVFITYTCIIVGMTLFLNDMSSLNSEHWTLQQVRLDNRGRLLLRTPGPVPFGTCIRSNVKTILSWTCHVYGPFEFRRSLGTSILLRDTYIIVCITVFVQTIF